MLTAKTFQNQSYFDFVREAEDPTTNKVILNIVINE